MSKIGKQIITLPQNVEVTMEGTTIKVKGPKGTLDRKLHRKISVAQKDGVISVGVKGSDKESKSLHGTSRAIIANMVKGVSSGWQKKLELVGTGYRAEVQGKTLVLTIGYINPVRIDAPENVSFKVEKAEIMIDGIDKEVVGQIAATIREVRPPEPYQGKGIRYSDEIVKKKPGKAAKAADTQG